MLIFLDCSIATFSTVFARATAPISKMGFVEDDTDLLKMFRDKNVVAGLVDVVVITSPKTRGQNIVKLGYFKSGIFYAWSRMSFSF